MPKKKSFKARKAALVNAARRPQQAPRLKIVSDGLEIPARTAVLSTMELLEIILCYVDMPTVLFAQRVNTKWRDIIGSSLPLQRHLFFAPAPPVPEERSKPLQPSSLAAHSLGENVQPWVQRAMERAKAKEQKRAHATPTLAPTQNPLLKKNFACMFVMLSAMSSGLRDWSRTGRASEDVNYLTTGKLMGMGMAKGGQRIAGQGKPTSFLRSGASWRRMLVAQPPPRRLEHVRVDDGRSWRHRMSTQYRSVDVPEGITMGQLYDLVYAITFDRSSGRLSWVGWPDGRVIDPNLTPDQDPTSGSRLITMSSWAAARSPRGDSAELHNWESTDCIVVGEEGVGPDFDGFCREHVDGAYAPGCLRCQQGQYMQRLKNRKRRLRNGVDAFAPFFRCEEYKTGGTLIEGGYMSDTSISDAEDSSEGDSDGLSDQDSLEDPTPHQQAGGDSSDDEAWDAASDSDEELP